MSSSTVQYINLDINEFQLGQQKLDGTFIADKDKECYFLQIQRAGPQRSLDYFFIHE